MASTEQQKQEEDFSWIDSEEGAKMFESGKGYVLPVIENECQQFPTMEQLQSSRADALTESYSQILKSVGW